MSNLPNGTSHHSASQTHLCFLRASQSSAPLPFIYAAAVVAIAQVDKGRPTMPARHHLLLCSHCHCALSSTLLPSMPLQEQARNGQQWQGTIVCTAATVIVAHCCLHCCRCCHCETRQGTGNNAKAPLSMLLLPFVVAHHWTHCCSCRGCV